MYGRELYQGLGAGLENVEQRSFRCGVCSASFATAVLLGDEGMEKLLDFSGALNCRGLHTIEITSVPSPNPKPLTTVAEIKSGLSSLFLAWSSPS